MGLLNVPLTSFLVLIVRNNVFIVKSDKIIYLVVIFIVLNGLTHPVDILVNFDLWNLTILNISTVTHTCASFVRVLVVNTVQNAECQQCLQNNSNP